MMQLLYRMGRLSGDCLLNREKVNEVAGINTGERVKYGIAAFSFGLRTEAEEPNQSNVALARATSKAFDQVWDATDERAIVVSQWEITKSLRRDMRMIPDLSVELRADGSYLDSKGVWEETEEVFAEEEVTHVIVIAQPFLHLPMLKQMVRASGFKVVKFDVGKIPFDNSERNTQPWTRSRSALLGYALKSAMPGAKHGHDGRQNAA